MRNALWAVALAFPVAAAGCSCDGNGDGPAGIVVGADPDVGEVRSLAVRVAGDAELTFTPEEGGAIAFDVTVPYEFPKGTGARGIEVDGLDSGGTVVAQGVGLAFLAAEGDPRVELRAFRPPVGAVVDTSLAISAGTSILGELNGGALTLTVAIGDLDGDGIGDVVVGAPLADVPISDVVTLLEAGRAYILFGRAPGDWGPQVNLADQPAQPTADVRFAGVADLEHLSSAIAVGDVNGDGYGDLILGANGAADSGRGYLFFGRPRGDWPGELDSENADVTIDGAATGDLMGKTVATADVTGDGIADAVLAAPEGGMIAGRLRAGEVYVFDGRESWPATLSTSGASTLILGAADADEAGTGLALGDVTDDGIADIVIGAPLADPFNRDAAGAAYVVSGGSIAGFVDLGTNADATVLGALEGDRLGTAVGAGDLDGDGTADFVIGEPTDTTPSFPFQGPGAVHVLWGSGSLGGNRDLSMLAADVSFETGATKDAVGLALTLGDLNDDGFDDVAIGAPLAEVIGPPNRSRAGIVFVVLGRARTALEAASPFDLASADIRILAAEADDNLGRGVAMGDADGDRLAELVTGSPFADSLNDPATGTGLLLFGGTNPTP